MIGDYNLSAEYTPGYQHLHHLVGSLQYLINSDVSEKLFNGIIFQITIASVHLQSLINNLRTYK